MSAKYLKAKIVCLKVVAAQRNSTVLKEEALNPDKFEM